jgi:phosphoribosyl-dephospho-CoA transferase
MAGRQPLMWRNVSMSLPVLESDLPLQRHQLVRLGSDAWHAMLASRPELTNEPWVPGWVDRGWPLVVRRPMPGEGDGVPLGLPLPPSVGKRRVAVLAQAGDILSVTPPVALADVVDFAPDSWRASLRMLIRTAEQYRVQVRVFGSLAWQGLTGLAYVGPDSDLDLLWTLPSRERLHALMARVAAIESGAPMRMDGELVRDDGAGVNWRELASGASEVVLKTATDVALCSVDDFVGVPA